jgi:hypothetical protein
MPDLTAQNVVVISALVTMAGVVLAGIIGALSGWFAARTQAHALLKSGREQAIETEKLRLRFSLVKQALSVFYARADRLSAIAAELMNEKASEWRKAFVDGDPQIMWLLGGAARRVMGVQHDQEARQLVARVSRHYSRLQTAFRERGTDVGQWPPEDSGHARTRAAALTAAVDALVRAVDLVADARVADRPSTEVSSALRTIIDDLKSFEEMAGVTLKDEAERRRGAQQTTPPQGAQP